MADKQKLEQKIGEALGLEMAAQKAVEELSLKGLLDQAGLKSKLEGMKKEAGNHQIQIEELVQKLSGSEELDSKNIQESAKETEQKASEMMKIYLGEEPDSSEAIEFLCLAEGGEAQVFQEVPSSQCQPPYLDSNTCNAHFLGRPAPAVNAGSYAADSQVASIEVIYRF